MSAPLRRSPFVLALLTACAAGGCGASELPPPPPPAPLVPAATPVQAAPSFQPAVVAPTASGEGTITRVESRASVPLTGPRVDAQPGDWLLQSGEGVAVVAASGRIVDLGARGGRDEITAIDPTVFLGLDGAHLEPVSIEPAGDGGRVLHVVRRVLEKPLLLHELVWFAGDELRVETAVSAAAPLAVPVVVTLGERIGWSNVPTWAAGQGFVKRGGAYRTELLARDSYGAAYAVCADGGPMLARFDSPDSGFHEPAATGEVPEVVPPNAPTARRSIHIAHAAGSIGKAAQALTCDGRRADRPVALPAGLPWSARVEVGRCAPAGRAPTPYARFAPDEAGARLPEGCFQMRLTAPGHTSSAWFAPVAAGAQRLAPSGGLRFVVTEKGGGALPARMLVRGVGGTRDPDWGDDPDDGAALNIAYSEKGSGERTVPPGRYEVTLDRGFEYTAVTKEVVVEAGEVTDVAFELARVVDTKGFIAADLHLHAMPSPDAIQPLADRVRALVATGVEVGVATDHNKITDYRPVIAELGAGRWLASVVGDEITTREPWWGHFNAFPLRPDAEVVPFRGTLPRDLFAAARAAGTLGDRTVVQVNHPRMGGIGYFDLLRFDRDDVSGWQRRVPVGDLSFDAIEVFNGDHYALLDKVEECMKDWYALLESGHRVTATGNSDSHKLAFHEPGVPRNLVELANDDPAAFDERAFIEAVRKGRVVVSSGPFIRLLANGKGIGDTIAAGDADIAISVDAPPWVDVDRVELVRRGEVIASWVAPFPKGPHRLDAHLVRALAHGDWILAIARGTKPMKHLHRPNARPFAFTNPIFVR